MTAQIGDIYRYQKDVYIKRHDEGLNSTWKGTEYAPIGIAL